MTEAAVAPAAMSVDELERIMVDIEVDENAGRPEPVAVSVVQPQSGPMLREFVDAVQLKKDVEFNVNDLDTATQKHAALFVHYSDLARLAARQYARMDAAFEILEAQLNNVWRIKLKEDNPKATEAMIESAVKSDKRWWIAKNRVIDAKAIHDLAKTAPEAFSQRKDMIVQISVDRRKEREGELRFMATQAGAGEQKSALDRALSHAAGAQATAAEMTSVAKAI